MPLTLIDLALYTHGALETPAFLNFFFIPSAQLPNITYTDPSLARPNASTPLTSGTPPRTRSSELLHQYVKEMIDVYRVGTEPLITSYALCLLSTIAIALGATTSDVPDFLKQRIVLGLAIYHLGPIMRAKRRIQRQKALSENWTNGKWKEGHQALVETVEDVENRTSRPFGPGSKFESDALGGPYVHLVAHSVVFALLVTAGVKSS